MLVANYICLKLHKLLQHDVVEYNVYRQKCSIKLLILQYVTGGIFKKVK